MKRSHIVNGCMITLVIMLAALCMLASVGLVTLTTRVIG